jgi:hypothetical protein
LRILGLSGFADALCSLIASPDSDRAVIDVVEQKLAGEIQHCKAKVAAGELSFRLRQQCGHLAAAL